MASAGANIGTGASAVPDQAKGAEYGIPPSAVTAEGGEVRVQVPASVADRFEAAKARHQESGGPAQIDMDTHKTGMEQVPDRARNLTAVTEAKVQSGGTAETRSPDVGFPAREHVH